MKKYKLMYFVFILQVCMLKSCFARQLHTPAQNFSKISNKLGSPNESKLGNTYANLMEAKKVIGKSNLFKVKQGVNTEPTSEEDNKLNNCSKCNRNEEINKVADMYNNPPNNLDNPTSNSVTDASPNVPKYASSTPEVNLDSRNATASRLNVKRNVLMKLNSMASDNSGAPNNHNSQYNGTATKYGSSNAPYDPNPGYGNPSTGYGGSNGYGMNPNAGGMTPAPMGASSGSVPSDPSAGMAGGGMDPNMGGGMSGSMGAPVQGGGYTPESYPPAGSVPGSSYPAPGTNAGQPGYGSDNQYGYSNDWYGGPDTGYGNGSYPTNPVSSAPYSEEDDIHESWKCKYLAIFFPECSDKPKKVYNPPPNTMPPVSQQYCNIYGATDLNLSDFLCNINDWLVVNQNNSIRLTSNKPVSTMQNIELKGNYCNKESVSCTLQLGENSTAGISVRGNNGERTLVELNSLTKTISLKQINNQTTQILLEAPYSKMNSNFLHLVQVNDGGFQGTLSVFIDGNHVFSKRDIPTQVTGLIGMYISSGNATFGNLSVTPS